MFQLTAARRRLDIFQTTSPMARGFNSQPPEGGWICACTVVGICPTFQLTAARRRLVAVLKISRFGSKFQLTAARRRLAKPNAHPVAADWFQLTAARRRLDALEKRVNDLDLFQLTAARRRLGIFIPHDFFSNAVSTHSRPKAAGGCCWQSA